MSYYERYKRRIEINGTTRQQRELNQKRKDFEIYMKNSGTYHQFKIYGSEIIQDCTIVDIDRVNRDGDEKNLLTRWNSNIKKGDEVHVIDDGVWIVVEEEFLSMADKKVLKIRPCNYRLRWLNKFNKISERWVRAVDTTMYSIGKKELEYVTVPDGKLQIICAYDDETKTLTDGKNIMFYDWAYQLTFDSNGNLEEHENKPKEFGFLKFTLKQRELSSNDNKELRIADYYNRPVYRLSIQDTNTTINISDTRKLSHKLYVDDTIYSDNDYTLMWESDNSNIAIVDNNGNIQPKTIGKCNIKCYLKENPDIFTSIEINVVNEITNHVDVYITGDDKLEWQWDCYYEAIKLVNGIKQDIQWNYSIDYMGNKPDIVKLSVINNKAKIIANDKWIKGTIKLIAINGLDKIEKQIKIVGWGE